MKRLNINQQVRRIIDNNIAIRKLMGEGLINNLALARKILKDYSLQCKLSAVLSAIRRYEEKLKYVDYLKEVYKLLHNAKLNAKTKLVGILVKKNQETKKRIVDLYLELNSEEIFLIFETSTFFKVICDIEKMDKINNLFSTRDITEIEKNIGLLIIRYSEEITKTPGVFALIANELGANDISIVDSLICHSEHIIVVREKDIMKAFNVIFELIHRK